VEDEWVGERMRAGNNYNDYNKDSRQDETGRLRSRGSADLGNFFGALLYLLHIPADRMRNFARSMAKS
jgi:hypothetical protein